MASRRKRAKLKEWLSNSFLKDGSSYTPDGRRHSAAHGGFFDHAQGVAVHNSPMTSIQGNQYTTYVQGDRNIVPQMMNLLSQHIIFGAAHDDSARTPPPRCHPDTRVKLIARITAWFDGQAQQELLLWITGPAGVGKSAVVQTFAEYLTQSKSLGASVFISRPNKRNNPHGIFITIAYQLATRIVGYRRFIAEKLSLDPSLLNKGMEAQFSTFIVESFVERKIGAGGKRWGILLDGLDELRGEDAQCNIIQLISTFVHEHRDTPLVWIIASRPESHISNTFEDDEVRHSCWSEYIPIDSTEACADVDRFLRSSFNIVRKKYRQSIPSDWPSDTDFLKLTAAASGLFVYAQVVMEFIRDSDHADPISRFRALLSVIDHSTVSINDNPFIHLDALYHEIVSSIPSALWPTAKQLLGFTIYAQQIQDILLHTLQNFETPRGMSLLFSLNLHTIYACLTKCPSTLKIPSWKAAHKEKLTFLHASFADYLKDPRRSGDFYVGNSGDIEENALLNILEIWNKCGGDDIATVSVGSMWAQHCSQFDEQTPSRAVAKFYGTVFHDVVSCVGRMAGRALEKPAESLAYVQLRKVHMAKLCHFFLASDFADFVRPLEILLGFNDEGFCRRVQLRGLKFGHLDWKDMSPAKAQEGRRGRFSKEDWILHRPHSSAELRAFVSELGCLQKNWSKLEVVIFGGVSNGRVVAFRRPTENGSVFYVIPYPE